MKFLMKLGTTLAAMVLWNAVAKAEDVLPANRTTTIYEISQWRPDTCTHMGVIRHKLISPPKHGTASFTWAVSQNTRIPARCRGKIKSLFVSYRPNKGYRGNDSFSFDYQVMRYDGDGAPKGRREHLSFTVK